MTLNAAQLLAVSSTAALRVVIAGPGSGKTRTMVEAVKSVYLEPPNETRIAVMTFTNAGANEFRHRLSRYRDDSPDFGEGPLGVLSTVFEPPKLAHCGTLHSYAFKLIQRFGGFLGYIPGKVGILPEAERIPRLLQCRDKLGFKKLSQKHLLDVATWPKEMAALDQAALVWKEYEFLLKRNNLVDYDGILRVALELLRLPEVRCQIKLDYLFVDEFQDSAQIDQMIYEAIPAENKMYVGDGDQSIFGFRGANPMGFVHLASAVFDNSITDAEGFKLELNYRSDSDICDAANELIACNKERVEKVIIPTSGLRGQVQVDGYEDVMQELSAMAGCISQTLATKQTIAVLYRMNHDVKQCRDYLQAMGLPVQRPKFEQRPPDWERAMLLLSMFGSPENDILVERWLRLDHPAAIVDRWLLEHQAGNTSAVMKRVRELPDVERGIGGFVPLLYFLAHNGVGEATTNAIRARMELMPPDADLSDLLHDLHSGEEPKASNESDGVYVGTIHSAKGREFDVVFLPAFEQGIIPSNKVDELEENRRLAFVAVTRARHELYISWCSTRRLQWETRTDCQPSQFISEMGLS